MSEPARSQDASPEAAWERAWRERYEGPTRAGGARRARSRAASQRARLRDLLIATTVLLVAVTSIAVAESGDKGGAQDEPGVTAARGEGDPIALGDRNPGSGGSGRETAIVADVGNSGLVLRPSNTAKGGRAVSATCDNDGQAAEDGCAVYVNKGTGAAASFRTQGSVPFAIRDTNTGLVQHLNADMVDGQHASAFLGRGERAADSALLGGNPASAYLGSTAKAADSEALDGKDSSEFLGATSKAADSETLDGKDSSEFLGATAKAADADTLDGQDSKGFARLGGAVFINGDPAGVGFTSEQTATGVYRVNFPAGTFKTATSCKTPSPVVVAHADTAIIATVAVGMATCSGVDGSGGFTVRTFNAAGGVVDSAFWFMVI
jgi:hypothetical protein